MTRKPTKLPRRKAKARKTVSGNRAASPKPPSMVEANTAATSPVVLPPPAQPSDVAGGPVNPIQSSEAQPVTLKKEYPSARSAIVSAAFDKAISGKIRRKLKAKDSIAVIFLVPEQNWIEPVQKIFASRFGPHWQTVAVDSSNNSAAHKSARNAEVATHLARGRNVVGMPLERGTDVCSVTLSTPPLKYT
jgi:hypothetical protein